MRSVTFGRKLLETVLHTVIPQMYTILTICRNQLKHERVLLQYDHETPVVGSQYTRWYTRSFLQVAGCHALLAAEFVFNLSKAESDSDVRQALSDIVTAEIERQSRIKWRLYGLNACPSKCFCDEEDNYQRPSIGEVRISILFEELVCLPSMCHHLLVFFITFVSPSFFYDIYLLSRLWRYWNMSKQQ